jgi:Autographiviridae endonuclease VII
VSGDAWRHSAKGKRNRFGHWLMRKYGMTVEDYARMELAQNRCCAGCSRPLDPGANRRGVHVDHCHTTGKVRGLLCYHCNASLGLARDSPETLRQLADYVERNR